MPDGPSSVNPDGRGWVSLLTPPGRGGVAVLRVREGEGGWIRSHFRPRGEAVGDGGRVQTGWIVSGEEIVDEVLLRRVGPGEAEVHCHAGRAVAERIIGLAEAAGMVRLPAREVALSGDPIRREALSLLVEAETDAAARMLAGQASGLLSRRLDEILTLGREEAAEAIDRLLASASFGVAAAAGCEVWIIGPPNAGKSTLLNALLGWERVIVDEVPGTTRDLIREKTSFGGIPVELVDTPGIRAGGSGAEAVGIERVERGRREGRRGILCIDGSRPFPHADLVGRLDRDRDLLVVTKSDLPAAYDPSGREGFGEALRVSAVTGDGIGNLREAILRRIAPDGMPEPGSAIVFTPGQEEALRRARQAIAEGDLDEMALQVRQCRSGEDNGSG